jgi:mono/diheme cytochrome c family protein
MMIGWDMLFAGGKPDAGKDIEPGGARRGDYLVNRAAHCGTCHTPRNLFMAEKSGCSWRARMSAVGTRPTSPPTRSRASAGWSEDDRHLSARRRGAWQGAGRRADGRGGQLLLQQDER